MKKFKIKIAVETIKSKTIVTLGLTKIKYMIIIISNKTSTKIEKKLCKPLTILLVSTVKFLTISEEFFFKKKNIFLTKVIRNKFF